MPLQNHASTRPVAPRPKLMHPGAVLFFQYLQPNCITIRSAAFSLGFRRLEDCRRFLGGFSPVTPELAARLETLTGRGASYWLELQRMYDGEG